ncbi:MAG: hypothetical protein Q9218_005656, partial [Villophora microphyllina]
MFPFAKKQRYSNIPYTPLTDYPPTPRRRLSILRPVFLLSLTVIAATIVLTLFLHDSKLGRLQRPLSIPVIPRGFRVVGLVFYGRRSRIEVLNCYLQQNLKANGGLLDEIIFLVRTDDVDDLAYLNQLVANTAGYTRRNLTNSNGRASKITYGQAWEVVERGTMYIKIDDDIMFIERTAIASLIATKVAHP